MISLQLQVGLSEVQHGSLWTKTKMATGLHSLAFPGVKRHKYFLSVALVHLSSKPSRLHIFDPSIVNFSF